MGILRSVFGALETKAATNEEATSHAISGSASGRGYYVAPGQWDTEKAVRQGFEKVIWVFRCVDVIATNQSSLSFEVVKGYGDDGVPQSAPNLHKLLNVRPNNYETAMQFRYRLSSMLLLSRRGAFIETVGGKANPQALHLLPSNMVEPIPDPDTFVRGYKVRDAIGTEREVPPDDIIWIKSKPHPLDPYQQMNPLVASGLAIDTDYLARMFNRNFLLNDGRPGLLITVRGSINREDAEELKNRFGGGYDQAGKTTVIEGEGLDVADMSASPRDSQWLEAIQGSKQDIMLAFGVPESVMGNASGRTFDNADAERENFWMDTMVPHCDSIANGLDVFTGNLEDDTHMAFNYTTVDVLQRQKRNRHATAVEDWQNGKITWNEMREICGLPTFDVLQANMIFGPSQVGFTKSDDDNEKIPELPMYGVPPAPAPPGGEGMTPEGMSESARAGALKGTQIGSRRFNNVISARTMQLRQRAALVAKQAKDKIETKDDDIIDAEIVHPHEELFTKIEAMSEGMLLTWCERQSEVVQGRLDHAKARKGTRHWEGGPEYKATRTLDPDYVVEVDRWSSDMRRDFESALRPVLQREALRVARDMDQSGILRELNERGVGDANQKTALDKLIGGGKHERERLLDNALNGVLDIVEQSTRNQSRNIANLVEKMEDEGKSLNQIKTEVRKRIGTRGSWRQGLSRAMSTSAIEGLKESMYSKAGDMILKRWNAIEDEATRPSHFEADGLVVAADEKFLIGKSHMSRPGDPTAPIEETANCFPADTLVQAGLVDAAYQRWYSGEMIEVVTREGKHLTGTPNHPVLTSKGWVPLQFLAEGDHLIGYSDDIDPAIGHDVQGGPTQIGKMFDALSMSANSMRVGSGGVNFHGDVPQGDVDVVLTDCQLRDDAQLSADEFVRKFVLPSSDPVLRGLFGLGPESQRLVSVGATTPGFVGGNSKVPAFVGTGMGHAAVHGSTAVSGRDIVTGQEVTERTTADPVFASKSLLGLAGQVTIDDVLAVRRIECWSGHVYNLSTGTGAYSSNGIIVHNCRCYLTFMINPQADL